jgi:hypothetical protein
MQARPGEGRSIPNTDVLIKFNAKPRTDVTFDPRCLRTQVGVLYYSIFD